MNYQLILCLLKKHSLYKLLIIVGVIDEFIFLRLGVKAAENSVNKLANKSYPLIRHMKESLQIAGYAFVAGWIFLGIIFGQVNVLVLWRKTCFNIIDSHTIFIFCYDLIESIDSFKSIVETSSVSNSNGLFSNSGHFWPIMNGKLWTFDLIVSTDCCEGVVHGWLKNAQINKVCISI